jgi:hypothetical protein
VAAFGDHAADLRGVEQGHHDLIAASYSPTTYTVYTVYAVYILSSTVHIFGLIFVSFIIHGISSQNPFVLYTRFKHK